MTSQTQFAREAAFKAAALLLLDHDAKGVNELPIDTLSDLLDAVQAEMAWREQMNEQVRKLEDDAAIRAEAAHEEEQERLLRLHESREEEDILR